MRGGATYEVELRRVGNEVLYSCSCPYFDQYVEVCKHLWATLLAASARIDLAPWAARGVDWIPIHEKESGELKTIRSIDDEESDDGESSGPVGGGAWQPPSARGPKPAGAGSAHRGRARRPVPPAATWRRLISELEGSAVERALGGGGAGERTARDRVSPGAEPGGNAQRAPALVRAACRGGRRGVARAEAAAAPARTARPLRDPEDRALLGLLAGLVPGHSSGYGYGYFDDFRQRELVGTRFELEPYQLEALGPRLPPPAASARGRREPTASWSSARRSPGGPSRCDCGSGCGASPTRAARRRPAIASSSTSSPGGRSSRATRRSGSCPAARSSVATGSRRSTTEGCSAGSAPRRRSRCRRPRSTIGCARSIGCRACRRSICRPSSRSSSSRSRPASGSRSERPSGSRAGTRASGFPPGSPSATARSVRADDVRGLLLDLPLRRQRRRDPVAEASAVERLYELGALPAFAGQRGRADLELRSRSRCRRWCAPCSPRAGRSKRRDTASGRRAAPHSP